MIAHLITSDVEAIDNATKLAASFALTADERDRKRRLLAARRHPATAARAAVNAADHRLKDAR